MKPDQYYTVKELVKAWDGWDFSEEELLKYGSEGTLQFLIKRKVLEQGCPGTIQFYCPLHTEAEKRLCALADNQSFFYLSQETIDDLRNPNAKRSKVALLQMCRDCKENDSAQMKLLSHKVKYDSSNYEHFPGYNDINSGIKETYFSDVLYCQKDDLLVSQEEKESFENKYLQDALPNHLIAKNITLLRAIGTLLLTFVDKPPYKDLTGKFNANQIADWVEKSISAKDIKSKGISNRKLREIIPAAIDIIRQNKDKNDL